MENQLICITLEKSHNKMEEELIKCLESKGYGYVKIENKDSLEKIYNLFVHDQETCITDKINDDVIALYIGAYFSSKKNNDEMIKYYLIALEKGNCYALTNLINFYEKQQNFENMKKYLLIAVNKGSVNAMNDLGYYRSPPGNR